MSLLSLQFAWPWLLLLLPLPLLVRRVFSPRETQQDSPLQVPFIEDFDNPQTHSRKGNASKLLALLASLAWCCLVIAAARPQWSGERVEIPVSGRDLMMAVDLSRSMAQDDFKLGAQRINRLQAVKHIAGDFIQRREGDRIGLILFGQQAYLQTPLTFDTTTVNAMLQESLIGIAGQATAIGDAIGLAIKRLQHSDANSRVLILLTDGTSTAGELSPQQAAELAARQQLKIYTIGVGAKTRELGGLFFSQRVMNTEIDEKTLQEIATITGGQYFRATNTEELEKIYSHIEQLEPVEQETQSFRPVMALFMWPLSVAFILVLLILLHPALSQLMLRMKALLSRETVTRG